MLFRKVGAEKEEGRPKVDSLSETLRVLETARGLGEPKRQVSANTQRKQTSNKKNERHAEEHMSGSEQRQETGGAVVRGW